MQMHAFTPRFGRVYDDIAPSSEIGFNFSYKQLFLKFFLSLCKKPRKEQNVNYNSNLKFIMNVIRTHFDGNADIGAFAKLTNSYCLVGIGGSANFYSDFQSQLGENILAL